MPFDPRSQRPEGARRRCDSCDSRDSGGDITSTIATCSANRSVPTCDSCDSAILPAQLITVRPGPVLHVWREGQQVAAVRLTPSAALCLAADLLRAMQMLNFKEQL